MTRFVAIDFETANSFALSPCALGLVIVEGERFAREKRWLIRPPEPFRWFEPFNIKVHGIAPRHVTEAPEFPKVWREISALAGDLPLVAHNGSFDFDVLALTLHHYGLGRIGNPLFCSLVMAQRVWPELPHKGLKPLCEYLDFPFRHHDPLEDARGCAYVTLRACERLGVPDLFRAQETLGLNFGEIFAEAPEDVLEESCRKLLRKAEERRAKRFALPRSVWAPENRRLHEGRRQRNRIESALDRTRMIRFDRTAETAIFRGSDGQEYQTGLTRCDCLDFVSRKTPCKHMYRLAMELGLFRP